MGDLVVGLVAGGFIRLLASQISVRILSFALNLLIARRVSPESYGVATVQFHLIISTILLLSREGFRRGCLRFAHDVEAKNKDKDKSVDPWSVLSVAWLTIPIGIVVSICVCAIVVFMSGDATNGGERADYIQAVIIHGAAAVVELMAEPFYILATVEFCFGLRAAVDTGVLLTKSVVTLVLLGGLGGSWGLSPALAFSLAQLASAAVALVGYGGYGWWKLSSGVKRKPAAGKKLMSWGPKEWDVLGVTGLFTLQAAVRLSSILVFTLQAGRLSSILLFPLQAAEKQVLAEGSKLVLVTLQTSYNQGVYGLVSNLGSLVVRTLLQPLEEIAFAAFSRHRVGPEDLAGQRQLLSVLCALTKCVSILGLLSAAFGPAYSYTVLRLIYSTKWSETEAPLVLAAYSIYLLPLSINGVTEAFVHAVLDKKGLHQTNMALIAISILHIASSALAVTYGGAVGLVAADAVNMGVRVTMSMW
eukprot:gene20931-27781_t